MISITRCMAVIFSSIFLLAGTLAADAREREDKTESPYFFIKSDDPDIDRLPLKSTSASVNISGVIADVTVTQVYVNEGKRPIEAVYTFPASTRAAVYGMNMTIGKRTIIAEIKKRDEARQAYEQAKEQGKSASLLEQQRPNVFQMNVANILPKDRIVVELRYTELLVPADKKYEFAYPTVVGPRYVSQQQAESNTKENWTANPYLHQGEAPTYKFDISVRISAGLAIKDITCPSHKVDIKYADKTRASIQLDNADKAGGNRDFICRYRLSGDKIETGLLLSQGAKENFFLLMVQPQKKLVLQEIPPREYIFIVDVSGSMHGFPLDISKKLLSDLIGSLRPIDRFNVLLFSGSSTLMSEQSLPANKQNILHAIQTIDSQQGGGGTELLSALQRALSLPRTDGFSRTFIIATDGYVSVEAEAFDLIRKNLGKANLFAFGIGSSVNRHLMEGLAHMGMGEPFIVTSPEEAPETADKFRHLISSPALTAIKIDFGKFDAYDVEPSSVPDLLADRPLIVFGKWRGQPAGLIQVKGMTGKSVYAEAVDVKKSTIDTSSQALRYLWARHRITLLSDYNNLGPNDERIKQVTTLGLTYNLLTAYTSFVAIDSQVRLTDGKATTVKQPLPLPQGVSDLAVGGNLSCMKAAMAPAAASPVLQERAASDEAFQGLKLKAKGSYQKDAEVKLVKVSASKGVKIDIVRGILERNMPAINTCLSGAHTTTGEVLLTFEIDAQGRAMNMKTDKAYQWLKKCFNDCLKSIRFPGPEGGKRAIVTCVFSIN